MNSRCRDLACSVVVENVIFYDIVIADIIPGAPLLFGLCFFSFGWKEHKKDEDNCKQLNHKAGSFLAHCKAWNPVSPSDPLVDGTMISEYVSENLDWIPAAGCYITKKDVPEETPFH